MYDQRVTIRDAVRRIEQGDYLLPAIQREIVWKRDQITNLFDSVLQGYPIGTFLYWDLHEENWDEYTMYGFIKDYITSTRWIETKAQTRNSTVSPDGAGDLKLILDGQQRLSSFYIGLRGTYTYKEPYKWYRNRSSWTRSQLFLNVSTDPREETEVGGDRNTRYDFEFLSADYDSKLDEHDGDRWFRAGAILNYPDSTDIEDYIYEATEEHDIGNERAFGANGHFGGRFTTRSTSRTSKSRTRISTASLRSSSAPTTAVLNSASPTFCSRLLRRTGRSTTLARN